MNTQLTFNNTPLNVIDRNGSMWFASSDLAKALDYKSSKSITDLFNKNSDEFTPCMSEVVDSTTSDNLRIKTRIFSLRGAHLVAMFARTAVAKEFRKWVLDILDHNTKPTNQALITKDNEPALTGKDLRTAINRRAHQLTTQVWEQIVQQMQQANLKTQNAINHWQPEPNPDTTEPSCNKAYYHLDPITAVDFNSHPKDYRDFHYKSWLYTLEMGTSPLRQLLSQLRGQGYHCQPLYEEINLLLNLLANQHQKLEFIRNTACDIGVSAREKGGVFNVTAP